jgi:heavy metal efflux system protein
MVRRFIEWAVGNPVVVILLAATLAVVGGYAFVNVNVEAYPDPAPAIIEVVAQFPGASAEEVERQVTIPMEVALRGMPSLQSCRSKSLFGLSHLRNQFDYSKDYEKAKQEVINRLNNVTLPTGVNWQISPASPVGEILRYIVVNPKDPLTGKPIYSSNDIKALQDYIIQRELASVPRIAGVTGAGGTIKRYEIHPDPQQLGYYGIMLAQLQAAVGAANTNGSGDNLTQGQSNVVVRTIGLYARGEDPFQLVLGLNDARAAAQLLRAEEARRAREIRQTVVATVNNVPVRVDQLVGGGPMLNPDGSPRADDRTLLSRGVVVGYQTRQGQVEGISRARLNTNGERQFNPDGSPAWDEDEDVVQGIVLLYKGRESLPALRDVLSRLDDLNQPGGLLPGVRIEPYYNRSDLIDVTTETVRENLLVGVGLVTAILLMFLGNVRVALIVAINIPLALLFAFTVLFVRDRSANLLSIGAVDFGIIVDSTVILVEATYRSLTAGANADRPLRERIISACMEVERCLFFATAVMVTALLPLFTMKGPEGQIFGPMADTYAFALFGALLLALTVSPVLCLLLLKKLPPARDNLLVRALKGAFVWQLRLMLQARWLVLLGFLALLGYTGYVATTLGREFMPELEEGSLFVRGTFPVNISFDEASKRARQVRKVLEGFPEIAVAVGMVGRPDDGTDPTGYYNVEFNVPLLPFNKWPAVVGRGRPRTKAELVADLNDKLEESFPGVDWDISQIIRDNVMEALSGVKGENSIKIFGPDLAKLEELAFQVKDAVSGVRGVDNAGVFRIQGQSNLEFHVDLRKCGRWGVNAGDIQNAIETAVGGKAVSRMKEGDKTFDITLRWPQELRLDEQSILNIPINVPNNQVTPSSQIAMSPTPLTGGGTGLSATGTTTPGPNPAGSSVNVPPLSAGAPSRRLADFVTPLDAQGRPSEPGSFLRPGASTIYREQGQRFIAAKFGVRDRDLAGTVAEAKEKVAALIPAGYRAEWSGEFQEMEEAEGRLVKVFGVSLAVIVVLLYLSFRSVLDAAVVFANVLAMGIGGIWALLLAGLNFNISAAVGFISILGVAVMNGLLFVSTFNGLRAQGVELGEALIQGTARLVRPLTMTALAAILGLLPAALSTKIGSQSQQPLAIVVVGGMLATLLLLNLVPVLYSFYGKRQPPEGAGDLAH